jgi:carbamoyl-phosphate synthase small subunit
MKLAEAFLELEDGSVFKGFSFGAKKAVSGEVVFNTGMMGYPESLSDPSYKGQILAFTFPLIGNYGVPKKILEKGVVKNFESEKIHLKGIVVGDYAFEHTPWNSAQALSDWLVEENIPGITGIDCRALTKKLREKGTMLGKICFSDKSIEFSDPNAENLVEKVSCIQPITYGSKNKKILLIDCGVKHSIISNLIKRDVSLIRVPWNYDFFEHNLDFDAVLISNGPGDPKMCGETIKNVSKCIEKEIPTFGICLGNQILALAVGADTYKLKYGHRSQNQPVQIVGEQKCFITSQNHGFAVKESSLSGKWKPWFRNLNDGTNEGIRHKDKPFFSVQFHPEANPGPVDTEFLFDEFLEAIR